MKIVLIIVLLFVCKSSVSFGQSPCGFENEVSDLGIGVVECPESVVIFKDRFLRDTLAEIQLYSPDMNAMKICSMFFKPDYGILHFACLAQYPNSYKVLVNSNDSAFLERKNDLIFKTWPEYLLNVYGLRRKLSLNADAVQPVIIDLADPKDTLTIPEGHELFCPIEVKGDWIKIQYDCDKNQEILCSEKEMHCETPLVGWIRWRRDHEFLIEICILP